MRRNVDLSDKLSVASLIVSAMSLFAGAAVAIIVYRLGRRLDFRSRRQVWDAYRTTILAMAADMHNNGLNTDVLLLNADRYESDYDGGNRFTRHGYLQLRTEYIDVRHNGIALLHRAVPTWRDDRGLRSLDKTAEPAENAMEVGFVPFEYIEHIDADGNEFKNAPLVYVHFRGRGRSPFKSFTYHESTSLPIGLKGRPFYPQIPELGVRRLTVVQGWSSFWRTLRTDKKMERASARMQKQLLNASSGDR
jgi:hypothetical protein